MKNIFLLIMILVNEIVFCQCNNNNYYLIIKNRDGEEKLNLNGFFYNDTIYNIDKNSLEKLKTTEGLDGGSVILYNENGIAICKKRIVGPYTQSLSTLLSEESVFCDPKGRIIYTYNQGYIIFTCKRTLDY